MGMDVPTLLFSCVYQETGASGCWEFQHVQHSSNLIASPAITIPLGAFKRAIRSKLSPRCSSIQLFLIKSVFWNCGTVRVHELWRSSLTCAIGQTTLLGGSTATCWTHKEEKKKDDSDVAIGVNYGVASWSSWCKSTCNPETGITRTSRPLPWRLLPPFKGEHLERARTS